MEATTILFIGRIQANQASLALALEKRYRVLRAASGKEGLSLTADQPPQAVILDAASMRTPGERVCRALRNGLPSTPIIHLHPGPKREAQTVADVLLFPPVSSRRLLNAVDRLLKAHDDALIACGPFTMNLARRILVVQGQETHLTPKQALLIEMFLRNPDRTLDRKTLMEKVWNTNYLGDTRTLDVHIRWIRQVIEADPSNPRYLRTVRGIGYRLDLSSQAVETVGK